MSEKKNTLIERLRTDLKLQAAVGLLVVGGFLLVMGNGSPTLPVFGDSQKEEAQVEPPTVETGGRTLTQSDDRFSAAERAYEDELAVVLGQVKGVSDVSIVVNVESDEKLVVEKDRQNKIRTTNETDKEGGKRTIDEQSFDEKVVIVQGKEGNEPLVLTTEKPRIRGVLIVCRGVEDVSVKKDVILAVTRVLDVPSHKVSVLPKNK
ncbi:MAG: stage III sporulation protein AG [Bacilli bacterium]